MIDVALTTIPDEPSKLPIVLPVRSPIWNEPAVAPTDIPMKGEVLPDPVALERLGDAGDGVPLDAGRDCSAGARCVDSLDLIGQAADRRCSSPVGGAEADNVSSYVSERRYPLRRKCPSKWRRL